MSTPIDIVLLGGPKECDGVRYRLPDSTRKTFYVPYEPGRRLDQLPNPLRTIRGAVAYRQIAVERALYEITRIHLDYTEVLIAVSVDLPIGEAGKRLVEFYGRSLS